MSKEASENKTLRPYYAGTDGEIVDIDKLEPFYKHPFIIPTDSDPEMKQLITSIETQGLLNLPVVRTSPRDKSKYEIISGHRRVEACKSCGYKEIFVKVFSMTDDEATAFMISSNINRLAKVSLLERVKACSMMYDVMKHQKELVGEIFGITPSIVQKYLDLTVLTDELLQSVNEKRFPLSAVVAISRIAKNNKKDDRNAETLKRRKLQKVSEILIQILNSEENKGINITPTKAKKIAQEVEKKKDEAEITPESVEKIISVRRSSPGNVMLSLKVLQELSASEFGGNIKASDAKTKIMDILKEHFSPNNS